MVRQDLPCSPRGARLLSAPITRCSCTYAPDLPQQSAHTLPSHDAPAEAQANKWEMTACATIASSRAEAHWTKALLTASIRSRFRTRERRVSILSFASPRSPETGEIAQDAAVDGVGDSSHMLIRRESDRRRGVHPSLPVVAKAAAPQRAASPIGTTASSAAAEVSNPTAGKSCAEATAAARAASKHARRSESSAEEKGPLRPPGPHCRN
mmetsp:Transcript_47125/g.118708  ORF Transcript_47125/g.118708 Transcript_47125/m.118708 type:complete len:210 (-) Transcript_47125:448-1077(-)